MAYDMNNLQVQLAQSQEALRRSELDRQQGLDLLTAMKTRCRHLRFTLNQVQIVRKDLGTRFQIVSVQKSDMQVLLDIQEANKENLERQVAEGWRSIERLTEIIHGLRNHLDGHKLSQDERAIDVACILLEKERYQSQVGDLKHHLVDFQTVTEAKIRTLTEELAICSQSVRSKDEQIAELERACTSMYRPSWL